MARSRNIKPGFFKNADLVELPIEARLLFIGLWTLADRGGRLEDRPKQIKMELFPADPVDVDACLDGLQRWGFVQRYEVAGRRLLQVVNFDKHQNPHRDEKVSALPSPDGSFDEARCKHGASTVQKQCGDVAGTVGIGLIPDSLIPDSPIPEEKKASRKRSPPPPDCPPDVSPQVWEDWLTLRRKKAAPVTATVLESARAESVKAGMGFEAFLTVWCARGSQGLQADWLKPHERPQSHSPPASETAYQRSMRERVASICPSIAAKPPNHSETFDVTAKTLGREDLREVDADLRSGVPLSLGRS